MKVSIITIAYNSISTIKDTIDSVLAQDYHDIEYIIVDGASTDGTVELVKTYGQQINTLVSEPDQGIYDAMNKGLALATGDIIGILNSDDLYAHKNVISHVVATMQSKRTDSVYADLKYVKRDQVGEAVRYWKSGSYKRSNFLYGWMPPHPTFFVKREVYERYGMFNTALNSAADYELMLRFLFKNQVSAAYLSEVTVLMRLGGQSNASLKNWFKANCEDRQAWKMNQLPSYFFTTAFKPIRKLPQFVMAA